MYNLIYANWKRIWKNRAFQVCGAAVAGLALFQILMSYQDYVRYGGEPYFDYAFFSISAVAIFPLAIFTSLYIGTEYTDGTLRNKVAVGHGRSAIYIANLITSIFAGWVFLVIWSVAYLVPGMILMESANPLSVYLCAFGGMFCELSVFAAIFTGISMVLGKMANSSIACILMTLFILAWGTVIQSTLDQEEFYAPSYNVSEDGEIEYTGELVPNPNYLPEGSTKRAVYELLLDLTPGGQVMQLCAINVDHINQMMLYDLGWFAAVTGSGILMFRRKMLK